ncbi:hypothetical protein [uncultured Thiodictyon sp.]|jgi:hypothetical protein|uniref:hypothetical protein n=1 Tax=uncultured Thiodictyon sp. TaxID=1846217 RepID=UPI0025E36618|nr:hypothetical protein [uncultured Thiodictyon sp.]
MSQRVPVLEDALAALAQTADRLAATHAGVTALFPLTASALDALSETDQERLDAYAIRYALPDGAVETGQVFEPFLSVI